MTTLRPGRYIRRPFPVEAVQITAENMYAVADWCGARVAQDGEKPYIELNDHRGTKGFVTDWVTRTPTRNHFRVYSKRAFDQNYRIDREVPDQDLTGHNHD